MSDKDKIRQEIERLIKEVKDAAGRFTPNMGFFDAKLSGIYDVMAIIDSLPGEIPPYITGFKGDPDPPGISELEKAAARYERENRQSILSSVDIVNAFIEGAKWQANQLLKGSPLPEDTVVFQKGVAEGRRLEREDRNDDKLPRFYGD